MKKLLSTISLMGIILALTACNSAKDDPSISNKANEPSFEFSETSFDFGTIKQSGGIVEHEFEFTYTGDQPIEVKGTPGSCLCTTGKISKKSFIPKEKGILTVKFDPNLHAEPEGKFFKSVSILTEPPLDPMPEVKIWTEIDLDLGPDAFKLKEVHNDNDGHHDDEESHENGKKYHTLKASELERMLSNKDFFLLDVHIPEQSHIPKTDAFMDYREVTKKLDQLPPKNSKIVVYCRSGSMSTQVAHDLAELGYSDVYNLEGGINAFNSLKQ